jgi:3',5'-cyclic AMP phosphodiesterase CpdA
MTPVLTFVHISDTHLGPSRDFMYHGRSPYACLERLVAAINDFPVPPDFVLHTGDISDDASAASYERAEELLSRLKVPIYYVNGNHDDRGLLRAVLTAPPDVSDDPDAPLDYTFEVKGERFLVLDALNPVVPQPNGYFSAEQLAWARAEAMPDGPPLTVLIHYPPFPMGSPWLDQHMIVVNGADLHAAILPARERLRGVFFGHLHRSSQIIRDGITYLCAPSSAGQYGWRPWDGQPKIDPDTPPGYNVVHYGADQLVVWQYTLPQS